MNNIIHVNGMPIPYRAKRMKAYRPLIKYLVAMKLFVLILLLGLNVSANVYSQLITLSAKNEPLTEVMKSIRKQSGYFFMFPTEIIATAKPVNVTLKNATIEETLQAIFADQPFTYQITEGGILLKPKTAKAPLEPRAEQRADLTGQVVDDKGAPLEGATVILKEYNNIGAVTDSQGRYRFTNVPPNGTLLFTMIGHETKEVKYKGNVVANVVMGEVDADLNEVQVIAYGTVNKKFSTSNVGTVKGEQIAKQPVSNLLLTLQGRVPGLSIQQTSGVTASTVNITIQGKNSLRNGSDPFFVIDGIPYSPQFTSYSLMGSAIGGAGGSTFNFINPADIESISILKDADATAIYGSRAANGAILITTKKGKAGKTKLDVNLQNGWGKITRKLPLLNTQQYLEIRKEAYKNAGQTVPTSTTTPTESNYDLTVWDQNRYTDWQDVLVGGTAKYTDLQASVSGGSTSTQFMAGYGYHRETTVYPSDLADKKGNIRFNLNHHSLNDKFQYTLSASYLLDQNKLNGADYMGAVTLPPNAPQLYTPEGDINWEPLPNNPSISTFVNNPLADFSIRYKSNTNNLIANNLISYEIIPGLVLKSTLGFNRLQADEITKKPISLFAPETADKTREANYLTKSITSWIVEPQLSYGKTTRYGIIDALLGGTLQQTKSDVLSQTGYGYTTDLQMDNLGAATTRTINTVYKTLYKYSAIFARVNYRLQDKYILNLTARRDGSSRFGDDNKFNNFYAVGAAWLFGDEDFVKTNLPVLSYGKIRANYGTTGNDQIPDYGYLSLLSNYAVDNPYQQIVGLYPTKIANPLLQWEETRKLNLGVDFGFIKNRIMLNLNYFRNRSSNQLINYILPIITGFDRIDRNFSATVQNTGFEGMLDVNLLQNKSFSWQSSFNITIPKNKLIAFPGLQSSSYVNTYVIGQPINVRKVYQYAGVNPTTGLYQVIDSKGMLTSAPDPTTDLTQLVDINQKYYGGWANSFTYKGISLDFLLQYVKQQSGNNRFGNLPGYFSSNQTSNALDRWQNPGDVKSIQKLSVDFDIFEPGDAAVASNAAYSDASYIRLKNVSFSYTLPSIIANKVFKNIRVYAQGQNLLTFSKYKDTDPETQSLTRIPPLKMFTLGLQCTL